MRKPTELNVLRVIAMGALLSTGTFTAEEADKENAEYKQPSSAPRERRKLTPEQQDQYQTYAARHAQEIGYRRNVLRQERIFDLSQEPLQNVLNRLGNAHVYRVRARIRVINVPEEVVAQVRQHVQEIPWGMNLSPVVAFNDEVLVQDVHDVPLLQEAAEDGIFVKDGKDKKGLKGEKAKGFDEDDEEDEFIPVKGKGFRLYYAADRLNANHSDKRKGRRVATRARYSPQFEDLDSSGHDYLKIRPLGQAYQPVSHQVEKDFGLDHKGWGATSRPRSTTTDRSDPLKNINLTVKHPAHHLVKLYCRNG